MTARKTAHATVVEKTAERIVKEATSKRRRRKLRRRSTRVSTEFLDSLKPSKKKGKVKDLADLDFFVFEYEDGLALANRKKGQKLSTGLSGTNVTIFIHTEGHGQWSVTVPTQTFVISSEATVRKLIPR